MGEEYIRWPHAWLPNRVRKGDPLLSTGRSCLIFLIVRKKAVPTGLLGGSLIDSCSELRFMTSSRRFARDNGKLLVPPVSHSSSFNTSQSHRPLVV